ncbi:MAG: HAMP domain-containing protein [Schwartzia succinivorans]|nr:HAMP domain-containing protein [Schwartzia succinivorans]
MAKKKSIRRRAFSLMLSAVALCFFALSAALLMNIFGARNDAMENGEMMGAFAEDFTETFGKDLARKRLLTHAQIRAAQIDQELNSIKEDTRHIALMMERLLAKMDGVGHRTIPDPTGQAIRSGEVYIFYSPDVRIPEAMVEISPEIDRVAGIVDTIENTASFYLDYSGSIYLASEKGYMFCADILPSGQEQVTFTEEFLSSYNPKERPWYRAAEAEGKLTATDLYMGSDGFPIFDYAVPYWDEHGLAGVAGIGFSLQSFSQFMRDEGIKGIKGSGTYFTLNDKGEIVFSSEQDGILSVSDERWDLRRGSEESLAAEAARMVAGEHNVASVTLNGEAYFLAYAPIPSVGWSYGALIRANEVMDVVQAVRESVAENVDDFADSMQAFFRDNLLEMTLRLAVIMTVLFFISRLAANRFASPIIALTEGVREIATGNLDKKILIHTGDEVEDLANSVNDMTRDLKAYMENLSRITAEKERISADLDLAANIQTGMIPHRFPAYPDRTEVDLYASMEAAKEVGGDFYDFYLVDDNHLAVTMADVSGKGTGAALFMVIAKTMLKDFVLGTNCGSLGELVGRVNEQLRQENTEKMFVTAFIGILDLRTGMFDYVNAGHNPPLVYRAGESRFSFLAVARNFVLGGRKGINYQKQETVLAPGDVLFLYTDGVTEALNEKEELYGEERLLETLNRTDASGISAREILEAVRADVARHVGEAEQTDDITMLSLVYRGKRDVDGQVLG